MPLPDARFSRPEAKLKKPFGGPLSVLNRGFSRPLSEGELFFFDSSQGETLG
jgi:hypothetical protein